MNHDFPCLFSLKYRKALLATCALGSLMVGAPIEALASGSPEPTPMSVTQQVSITGQVKGNNGWTLPGVNITVKDQPGVGTTRSEERRVGKEC